jgi:hypothetical protein
MVPLKNHGAVELNGGGELGASLLLTSYLEVELLKVKMAVCEMWAHPKPMGQGKGLPVVRFSLLDVGMEGAKLAERLLLMPACLLLPGKVERLTRILPALVGAPGPQAGLAEARDVEGMGLYPAGVKAFPDRLLQECDPLGEVPRERMPTAQARRDHPGPVVVTGSWCTLRLASNRALS